MKKLLVIFVSLAIGTACFAGGVSGAQRSHPARKVEKKPETITKTVYKDRFVFKDRLVEKPKEKPSKGLAVGFHGSVPTITYNGKWYDVEAGYSSIDSDPQGIVKAGLTWASDHKGYTILKTGIALIQDNGTRFGWYVGCEQYIEKSISVTGDIYLVTIGENRTDILTAVIGGRLYLKI